MKVDNFNNKLKEKFNRFFDYCRHLFNLKRKVIRRIEDYEEVLWLYEIPYEKECFSILNVSDDIETILEVYLPDEPKQPFIPQEINNYIIFDESKNEPKLNENLLQQLLQQNKITKEELKRIREIYDVFKSEYIEWIIEHERWKKIYKIYEKLYKMYFELKRNEADYELIIGCGLLSWRQPNGQIIQRHILTAKCILEFEKEKKEIKVLFDESNPEINLELDMIDYDYIPSGIIENKKQFLDPLSAYELFSDKIIPFLKAFVNTLHSQGKYANINQPNLKNITEIPIIEFAPAIILRKRIEPYLEFLKDLQNLKIEEISPLILEIAEIERENENFIIKPKEILKDYQFYFPKPYNEEQKKIIEKLTFSTLVVIQGPPGTGKSHTIANLVAHLLAEGKRVLITAKTARALAVLKKLIPERLRQLCIYLLGDSFLEEKKHLEHSVGLLLSKLEEKLNSENLENRIKELEEKFQKITSSIIELSHQISELIKLEKENYKEIGVYKGSIADLAEQFERDKEEFGWFQDYIRYDKDWPNELNNINWYEFINNLNYFKSYERYFAERQLKNLIKNLKNIFDSLPNLNEIEKLIKKEKEFIEQLEYFEKISNRFINKYVMNKLNLNFLNECIIFFQNLKNLLIEIGGNIKLPWIKELFNSILRNDELMMKKINKIISFVDSIKGKEEILNWQCIIPKEIKESLHYATIISDIEILLQHLQSGGSLGFWIFRPNIVKERKYLIKNCFINGKRCNNVDNLKKMQIYLKVISELDEIYSEWAKYFDNILVLTPKEKYKILKERIFDSINQIIKHKDLISKCELYQKQLEITDISVFWDFDKITQLIDELNYFKLQFELSDIQQKIKDIVKEVKKINKSSFSIIGNLVQLLEEKEKNYEELFRAIYKIDKEKRKILAIERTLNTLEKYLPKLIDEIYLIPDYKYWESKIKKLKMAWDWARLKSFLQEIILKNDFEQLNKQVSQLQDEKRKIIEELVEFKAWYYCLSRIDKETKKHLVAWEQAVKKIGKGKGKYVRKYMRDAQTHLEKIIHSFPIWIMPIYKIYYTFKIRNTPWFDVLIIDEASQCSILEGIPLFQLASKVIIVGDDKQVSPEAVGVEKSKIFQLQDEYLYDFDFKDTFDLESSIFDLGKRMAPDIITLKEHFRCMPEIIEFCNRQFYNGFLVPLKVFSLDRLNPLEKIYVSDAYCKGSGNNIINPIEAEAIVKKIIEMCNNEQYKNKTIGVISLLGDAQAKYIESLLIKNLNHKEIVERQLLCGNPYSFQGDERDIIFLSMVIAPINEDGTKRHIGVLNKVQDERRLNVAISRAKEQIWLFHSVKPEDLSPECLRRKLLEYFYNPSKLEIAGIELNELKKIATSANRKLEKPPIPFESWFEFDVALEILNLGFKLKPQFQVGPYRIDLVIFDKLNSLNRLAVECDGDRYHGTEQIERDIERQRILERCGWKFFRIRASEFYFDRNKVLEKLKSALESLNIHPQ